MRRWGRGRWRGGYGGGGRRGGLRGDGDGGLGGSDNNVVKRVGKRKCWNSGLFICSGCVFNNSRPMSMKWNNPR